MVPAVVFINNSGPVAIESLCKALATLRHRCLPLT